jgi:hypothetical protein
MLDKQVFHPRALREREYLTRCSIFVARDRLQAVVDKNEELFHHLQAQLIARKAFLMLIDQWTKDCIRGRPTFGRKDMLDLIRGSWMTMDPTVVL